MKKFFTNLFTLIPLMLLSVPAFAQASTGSGIIAIGAGFCMGLAAFGGALGQSRASAAALEGIARNPQAAAKVQTPMIIALAMIESLVLFSLVIAFTIAGKVAS